MDPHPNTPADEESAAWQNSIGSEGTYTGLMGYERTFEHFGGTTLPYRALETFTYEVIDTSFSNEEDLDDYFSTRFASLLGRFAADINVTSLDFPNSQDFKEDLIRFQKHKLSVEVRTVGDFDATSEYGDETSKNLGLSTILPYYDMLEDLTDKFSFSLSEGGGRNYSHNIGFKLRTGLAVLLDDDGIEDTLSRAEFSFAAEEENGVSAFGLKHLAKSIAEELFKNEPKDLSTFAFGTYGDFIDSGTTRAYHNETFDELKSTFSFSKTKSILPFNSGTFSHDMSHTINYTENGMFSIEEKIKVKGNNSYKDAQVGLEEMLVGSHKRCEGIFSDYFQLAQTHYGIGFEHFYSDENISNNSSLVRTKTSKTFNVPNLTAEGSFSYTNDESKMEGFSRAETFNISREQNGIISLDHEIQYLLYNHVTGRDPEHPDGPKSFSIIPVSGDVDEAMDKNILETIAFDREASFLSARAVVNSITGLVRGAIAHDIGGTPPVIFRPADYGLGISSGITRTKTSIKSQDRKKTYSLQLSYSNSPVYDMLKFIDPFSKLAVGSKVEAGETVLNGFNMMSVDFSDEKPADIINEYTIINRPAQTNILSYGYQQEPARATISFKGNITRMGDNFATPLSYLRQKGADGTTWTRQLLRYGKAIFLERVLTDTDIYNYYLADVKYNFNSSNDFGMTLEFAYTKKKYGNFSP